MVSIKHKICLTNKVRAGKKKRTGSGDKCLERSSGGVREKDGGYDVKHYMHA